VALIDQADAGVVRLLSDANIDLAAVRTAALEMLTWRAISTVTFCAVLLSKWPGQVLEK
jgi:hypothetical protein